MSAASKGFRYCRTGPLPSVLKLEAFSASAVDLEKQVLVKMAYAPIHRTDAAIINGTALGRLSPTQATATPAVNAGLFPRIGGHEGIGVVVDAGRSQHLRAGDRVWISPSASTGTWATHVVADSQFVHALPTSVDTKSLPLASCATALFAAKQILSRQYAKIEAGDVVLVNGGSSLTAAAIVFHAKAAGAQVVAAVAPGSRFAAAKSRLADLGASAIVEYNPKGAREVAKLVGDKRVALFANGVGGPAFNDFARLVRGTCVTYGAQHGAGIMWSGGHQIFNGMDHVGFFAPRALSKMTLQERDRTFQEALSGLEVKYPVEPVKSLEDLALSAWDTTYLVGGKKCVFTF
uniref:Alcohol dehydrogenase-like N-terminal domain-containing protein n=1 Tax=Neobodo designis TaxID=312471 RepID=A0A7S1LQJ2_NEODS